MDSRHRADRVFLASHLVTGLQFGDLEGEGESIGA
jgi:hypothetical protein